MLFFIVGFYIQKAQTIKPLNRKIIILILILFISYLGSVWFFDSSKFASASLIQKNLLEIFFVFFTGILGFFGWKSPKEVWKRNVWVGTYSILIIFFLSMFLIDTYLFKFSSNNRFRFFSVKELFFSPLPFLLLWFIDTFFSKVKKSKG